MSLDKSIERGKERRKPYRGSKRFDRTCRNHGSCEWCKQNRLYSSKKRKDAAEVYIDHDILTLEHYQRADSILRKFLEE